MQEDVQLATVKGSTQLFCKNELTVNDLMSSNNI